MEARPRRGTVSSTAPPERKTTSIVVEIPRGCRYVPGDGPPLDPPTLLPPHDSTAFIRERVLLPAGLAADGKPRPKNLAYIVGWTDLPAANLPVTADRILDYVSPAALEDFEHGELLRRHAEAERAIKASKASVDHKEIRGRRRRTPRRESIWEVPATKGQEAIHKRKRGRPRKDGHSLSTPQKLQFPAVDYRERRDREEHDNAISRQPFGHKESDVDVNDSKFSGEVSSRREASSRSSLAVMEATGSSTLKLAKREARRVRHDSASRALPRGSQPKYNLASTAPISIPMVSHSLPRSQVKFVTPRPAKPGTPKVPRSSTPRSTTPIPVPKVPKGSSPQSTTPASVPKIPQALHRGPRVPSGSPPRSATLIMGFTPAGRSSAKWSSIQATGESPSPESVSGGSPLPRKRKKPYSSSKRELNSMEAPQEWVVEKIEDLKLENVHGKPARYFKVRWEGDWPPDQKSTWEPEDNLPVSLVQRFLLKRAKLGFDGTGDDKPEPWSPRKYPNVSEAFEDAEDAPPMVIPDSEPEEEGNFLVAGADPVLVPKSTRLLTREPYQAFSPMAYAATEIPDKYGG